MAAYNWISFEAICPNCNQVAHIRCQTHIASDFDGDATGRFCHRVYQLGDKMAWWPKSHKNFAEWREEWRGDSGNLPQNQAVEACYANCENCKADLCAVIYFENLVPVEIKQLISEADWPEEYTM